MNKPLVIFHKNCADGFGAAYAAYRKFGEDGAEYLELNYNDPRIKIGDEGQLVFPTELYGRDIYLFDFSFNGRILAAIYGIVETGGYMFYWRDHHKTAFEEQELDPNKLAMNLGHNHDFMLDPFNSGAVLAWELLHPETPVPELLLHVQDRDLWLWKMDGTREINFAIRAKPFGFQTWDTFIEEGMAKLKVVGGAMAQQYDEQLASVIKHPVPVVIETAAGDYEGLCVNAPPLFSSEAGNKLVTQCGTFGMTWVLDDRGMVNISLRSTDNAYDVSLIAKALGGGGHRNAAGCEVPFMALTFSNGNLHIAL